MMFGPIAAEERLYSPGRLGADITSVSMATLGEA